MSDLPFSGGQPWETGANTAYACRLRAVRESLRVLKEGLASYQVVGKVMAYQAEDE